MNNQLEFDPLTSIPPVNLVIGLSGKKGFTAKTVEKVRLFRESERKLVDTIFAGIESARECGRQALIEGNTVALGASFNKNHDCLRQLGVSCSEIETLVSCAARSGILGAKLTGSGGGGAVILLPEGDPAVLREQLALAGFESLVVQVQSGLPE
jgi:hydroxymethylglutaryl-CoA reductase/mevalonate kinase